MGSGNFIITQENVPAVIKLTVQGRLDSINAVELDRQLQTIKCDGQTHVVLNMSMVEYLSSNGIRVILKAYKAVKAAGGKFGIEEPSECVKNVLGLVALNEMLIA